MNKPFEVCLLLALPAGSRKKGKGQWQTGIEDGVIIALLSFTTERGINTTSNERNHRKKNRDDQHLHS